MGALAGAVGGAGLGLIQHNQKKAEFNRQKELAAQQEALSPWTGVHGQMPQAVPNAFQSVVQGGLSGATMGMPGGLLGQSGAASIPQVPQVGSDPMAGAQQLGGGMFSGEAYPKSSWQQQPRIYG